MTFLGFNDRYHDSHKTRINILHPTTTRLDRSRYRSRLRRMTVITDYRVTEIGHYRYYISKPLLNPLRRGPANLGCTARFSCDAEVVSVGSRIHRGWKEIPETRKGSRAWLVGMCNRCRVRDSDGGCPGRVDINTRSDLGGEKRGGSVSARSAAIRS